MTEIIILLEKFRNKAGCMHTQRVANKVKLELYDLLESNEFSELSTAHSHFTLGEGPEELYDVCKKLKEKYGNSK